MENVIKTHVGYHRVLVLFCVLVLLIFYPSEEFQTSIWEWQDGKYTFWFQPLWAFIILLWISLSDTLANVWRFLEFVIKKDTLWHFGPLALDILLVILLLLCYRFNINPPPPAEDPEEVEALLNLMHHMFRA